jgi:hypothetical protein
MGRQNFPTTAPRHSRTSGASVKSILSSGIRASAASSFATFLETFVMDYLFSAKSLRLSVSALYFSLIFLAFARL